MVLAWPGVAAAVNSDADSSSSHYRATEVQISAGSTDHSCSTGTYCNKASIGEVVAGDADSAHYSAKFGINETAEPLLEVICISGSNNMGILDNNTTGTATAIIKVRNYLSKGYVLQITGPTPSQGTHTLRVPMGPGNTPFTSQKGAEQFGINFATNTSPAVGADPVQVPSSDFSFGAVASDYATPDLFKYIDGDVVAQSNSSTGETDYTMSMIINVSNVTPGGRYNGDFSAVAVPIY